jgi:UDPglucose 6-dehydrogenase
LKTAILSPVVVDLRNIYRPEQMVGLGFVYTNLGGASNSA